MLILKVLEARGCLIDPFWEGGLVTDSCLGKHLLAPAVNEDFYTKTLGGGIITLAASFIIVLLFLSELGEPERRI